MTVYCSIGLPDDLHNLLRETIGLNETYIETDSLFNPNDPWDFVQYDLDENLYIRPSGKDMTKFDQDVVNGTLTETINFWNCKFYNNKFIRFENSKLTLIASIGHCYYPVEDIDDYPNQKDTIIKFNADGTYTVYDVKHKETDPPEVAEFYKSLFSE